VSNALFGPSPYPRGRPLLAYPNRPRDKVWSQAIVRAPTRVNAAFPRHFRALVPRLQKARSAARCRGDRGRYVNTLRGVVSEPVACHLLEPASPRNWRPSRYQISTEPVRLRVTMKQRPIYLHDTENVGRADAEEERAVSGLEHPQHLPRAW
jgi:hypothetical protein